MFLIERGSRPRPSCSQRERLGVHRRPGQALGGGHASTRDKPRVTSCPSPIPWRHALSDQAFDPPAAPELRYTSRAKDSYLVEAALRRNRADDFGVGKKCSMSAWKACAAFRISTSCAGRRAERAHKDLTVANVSDSSSISFSAPGRRIRPSAASRSSSNSVSSPVHLVAEGPRRLESDALCLAATGPKALSKPTSLLFH